MNIDFELSGRFFQPAQKYIEIFLVEKYGLSVISLLIYMMRLTWQNQSAVRAIKFSRCMKEAVFDNYVPNTKCLIRILQQLCPCFLQKTLVFFCFFTFVFLSPVKNPEVRHVIFYTKECVLV